MPSFDVSSEIDWQELDNAVNQTQKEVATRFDFKNVKSEVTLDKKAKTVTLWCAQGEKLSAVSDMFQNKVIKRGMSLHSLDIQDAESAFGGSSRQVIAIQSGISKEKGKEVIKSLKDSKLKVQAQIQDEKVRVTGKNRDDLQSAIQFLKSQQDELKIPMQFDNFRD